MYDFDTLIDRRHSDSAKWHKYAGRDIIPMWVADMDFVSPRPVLEALQSRISHGVFGYGHPLPELAQTVTAYLDESFHWAVDPKWIVWLPGLVTGLNVSCRAVGDPGDSILTTVPVYPPFLSAPANSGKVLTTSPMVQSDGLWRMDFDDIKKALANPTAMFILCNPHNPTGRVFTREELMTLAEICLDRKVIICSDEIHCDLVLDPGCAHLPLAALSKRIADSTITLMAPSKTYNIPGLSCSYAIIPNHRLRRRFITAMAGIVPHVNVMGMAAAQAAYQSGTPWLKQVRAYLRENRDVTGAAVNQMPGLHMAPGQATYLAWIDARELKTENPSRWFEAAGVGLSDGAEFKGPGFVRLNFGCPRSLLSRALERMADACGRK